MAEIVRRKLPVPPQRDRLSIHQFSPDPARYDRMTYRTCGRSGLKLPLISLGAWETFGGYCGAESTRECIFRAFNLGITHFDLADEWGQPAGRAETYIGRILRELPRDEVIISTKAGARVWPGPSGQGTSRKHLLASIDQSLQRLGLDYVDIFYAHGFDADTPLEETLAGLDQIARAGKALYLGLSGFTPSQLEEAIRLTTRLHITPILVQQVRYNFFERNSEKSTTPPAEVGTLFCSPLAQGMISPRYLAGFPESSRAARVWSEEQRAAVTSERKKKIEKLLELAKERGQTLPQMALAWVLRRPEATGVVMGASSVEQIEENTKALDNLKFSERELREIDQITQ